MQKPKLVNKTVRSVLKDSHYQFQDNIKLW